MSNNIIRCLGLLVCTLLLQPDIRSQTRPQDWVLTFADEFDGGALDLAKWSPRDPWKETRNREVHGYSPESVQVNGGMLHILAARGRAGDYISGIVTTFGVFQQTYGRFEVRCRIPAGRGLRPGFFLMPVPAGSLPTIEVFQAIGSAPTKAYFTNRWGSEQTERSYGESFAVPDLSRGFHTIALEWERDSLRWFVDGKEKFQSADGVPRQPMYLMLDLGVGGKMANLPDDATAFPASFDIDSVHVYQRPVK